jgi:hypothetical protein
MAPVVSGERAFSNSWMCNRWRFVDVGLDCLDSLHGIQRLMPRRDVILIVLFQIALIVVGIWNLLQLR